MRKLTASALVIAALGGAVGTGSALADPGKSSSSTARAVAAAGDRAPQPRLGERVASRDRTARDRSRHGERASREREESSRSR